VRLLANENVPQALVALLRARGHDVSWGRTDAPGSSDQEVLTRATREERVLLTFDKDFGELVFSSGVGAASGVVLLRFPPTSPVAVAAFVVAALEGRADWAGHFSVIEDDLIRMIPLP
jgi:predicted nuclease of predicted toxin-antitoxin system